ncbi:hypothetical protein KDL44_05545 [bacterium]|nr:hypothetical protein [bacterium]
MGQLPFLLDETRTLRKRDDFAVFTVAFDNPDREKDVDKVIRDKRIPHVVVWDHREATDLSNKADWNIKGFPTTMLINPDGIIQASIDIDEHLEENLLYFLNQDSAPPPIGLSISKQTDEEGNAVVGEDGMVQLTVDLYSPDHSDLEVLVDVMGGKVSYDEENDPEHENPNYESFSYRDEGRAPDFTASFGQFGSYSQTVPLAVEDGMSYLFVVVSVKLPGTEELNGGEGLTTSSFDFVSFN